MTFGGIFAYSSHPSPVCIETNEYLQHKCKSRKLKVEGLQISWRSTNITVYSKIIKFKYALLGILDGILGFGKNLSTIILKHFLCMIYDILYYTHHWCDLKMKVFILLLVKPIASSASLKDYAPLFYST